jgi:hypothetical protein
MQAGSMFFHTLTNLSDWPYSSLKIISWENGFINKPNNKNMLRAEATGIMMASLLRFTVIIYVSSIYLFKKKRK